jgi:hypothetical protein
MDPFVVISFGKKVFRTRVIRHSRDPEWNEKMLFHVRRYALASFYDLIHSDNVLVVSGTRLTSISNLVCSTGIRFLPMIE